MGHLVTVIVPIYKVEKYLHRCIDSILNQSYSDLEIILVDDGSPDNCGVICDEYEKKDPRIVVIHKKNGGLADARNVAVQQAKGDYITHIDSDDFVTEEYIETLLNLCLNHDAEISISGTHNYKTEKDLVIPEIVKVETVFDNISAIKQMLYQRGFDTGAWAKMYKRELYTDIIYSVELFHEDLATTYKLMLKATKIAFTNKQTYYYFQRRDSITGAFNIKKMNVTKLIAMMINDLGKKDHSLLVPLYCRILSIYFSIVLQMNENDSNLCLLWEDIKKYRLTVLKDPQARFKTKIACLLSFFGVGITKRMFQLIDTRR